jgi:hypothetical protein
MCRSNSVAKGPKFWPQNAKGAEKNFVGPGKSAAEFLAKKGPKWGRAFLPFGFALKHLHFRQKIVTSL